MMKFLIGQLFQFLLLFVGVRTSWTTTKDLPNISHLLSSVNHLLKKLGCLISHTASYCELTHSSLGAIW